MRCFISSPIDTDTKVLEALLSELGVESVHTTKTGPGALFAEQSTEDADFFVAVLSSKKGGASPPGVLVETGIALGKGLPTLLIAPPPTRVPLALTTISTVHASVSDRNALELHLRLFFRLPDTRSAQQAATSTLPKLLSLDFGRELTAIEQLPSRNRASAFEEVVVDLFRASGGNVAERSGGDGGVDAAVALPDDESHLGLVLIQAKYGTQSVRAIKTAQSKLQEQVLQRGAGLGLLILGGLGDQAFAIQEMPMIVTMSAEDLANRTREESLAEVLRQARNEAIHRF